MLKELCNINSASGDEKAIRNFIVNEIKDHCDYQIDNLGSVIAFKKGKKSPKKKVMFSAHMDEVGFIVTDINSDGYISIQPVGGIDPRVVIDRIVTVNGVSGVIGAKPVHLMSDDEKSKAPSFKNLYIDIGATSKEEALKYVSLGDYAYFSPTYNTISNDEYIVSKALDDRIGCMLLIELIKSELEYDTYFCFNVQEEVGLRGAMCTSYAVQSDISIILEATTAADLCGVTGGDRVCYLGGGSVVSFMDGRTVYDRQLYSLLMKLAADNNMNIQTKTAIAGGNDAGAIQTSGAGSRVIAISLPCAYIHSSSSIVKISDIEDTRKLIHLMLKYIYD